MSVSASELRSLVDAALYEPIPVHEVPTHFLRVLCDALGVTRELADSVAWTHEGQPGAEALRTLLDASGASDER